MTVFIGYLVFILLHVILYAIRNLLVKGEVTLGDLFVYFLLSGTVLPILVIDVILLWDVRVLKI